MFDIFPLSPRSLFSLSARYGTAFSIVVSCLAPVLLTSCSVLSPTRRNAPTVVDDSAPPRFSIVYVIHGDGGYTYHDTDGEEYRADAVALARARKVAARNADAEVFIFHQKSRHRFLGLFWRLRDGEFYYYRNGQLVASEPYWRGWGRARFHPEGELYHRFRARQTAQAKRFFLYFGHEVPETGGKGYDASNRDQNFTVDDLAGGLQSIGADSSRYDLLILSTCFNGTPYTVSKLAPYARYIVASPDNLHLSYLDNGPLEELDSGMREGDVLAFARHFARHSFETLTSELQTAVSVVVYDVDRVERYVNSVRSLYHASLENLDAGGTDSVEHFDCADDPAFERAGMTDGVDVSYRAARFGRKKGKVGHSGWECVRPAN